MSVWNRPYAGNYAPNRRKVTRYTPDAILLLNGDVSIPGHRPEKKTINIQKYVTQLSVDAGVDSGSCSASFTLSIPRDIGSSLFSDGHSVFTPGLEVHIYMRGFFPVDELSETLPPDELKVLKQLLGDKASKLPIRPYFHCFHGVTSTANLEYSGGVYSINQSCTGMLHFWQYHDISTNASLFGTRPTGSKLKMSLVGHNFTNMSPFSIVYSLYRDTAGSAGGVAYALSSSSNQAKEFFGENRSLFEMTQFYWEQRFETKMYNLRMFGVNGEQLNSAQTAMIGRMSTSQLKAAAEINLRHTLATATQTRNPTRGSTSETLAANEDGTNIDITGRRVTNKSFSNAMLQYLERAGEKSGYAVSAAQLKAFVNDLGQWGNVNLFESNYTSKLDIATAAAQAVGYEFYQDVDGDLVFKPPLYNLDTRNLEAYRIEPDEIISITRASAEPQCTYMTVKSGAFSNWKGLGLEGEWGIRGQYIDYRLVAKYGWRPGDFDAQFYSDARGAFWAAVARMDVINEAMETANITIPLRPELRPGFPIYVQHLDCFYYVKSMSHSFSYGGSCTTSLQCVAQRKKFMPPGVQVPASTDSFGRAEWGSNGIRHVQLSRPDRPSVPLVMSDGASGEVKLVGYPNVVMALDPNAISPLSWAFGEDVVDLTNPDTVKNLIMKLSGLHTNMQLLKGKEGEALRSSPVVRMKGSGAPGSGAQVTQADVDGIFEYGSTPSTTTFQVLVRKIDSSGKREDPDREGPGSNQSAYEWRDLSFDDLRSQVENYARFLDDLNENPINAEASVPGSQAYQDALNKYREKLNQTVYGSAAGTNNATIFDLLDLSGVFTNRDPAFMNSAGILELLGDKKANFSNASTPGYYRYWSSAAPNPEDQAPGTLAVVNTAYGVERNLDPKYRTMSNYSSGMFKDINAMLSPPQSVLGSPSVLGRYVEWDSSNSKPVRTFRIAGTGGSTSDVHTDAIHTLKFSAGIANIKLMTATGSTPNPFAVNGLEDAYAGAIETWLSNDVGTIPMDAKIGDAYSGAFAALFNLAFPGGGSGSNSTAWFELTPPGAGAPVPVRNIITSGVDYKSNDPISNNYPAFGWQNTWGGRHRLGLPDWDIRSGSVVASPIPTAGNEGGAFISLFDDTPASIRRRLKCFSDCKCYAVGRDGALLKVTRGHAGSPLDTSKLKNKTISESLHAHVARKLAKRVIGLLNLAVTRWNSVYSGRNVRDTDDAKKAWLEFSQFGKEFNAVIGYNDDKKNLGIISDWTKRYRSRNSDDAQKLTSVVSPIFPISDAGGYRHYGSYAYGRGVTVGVGQKGLEQLLSEDPLEEIDGKVVDEFVSNILKNGSENLRDTVYNTRNNNNLIKSLMELQSTNPAAWQRATRSLKIRDPNLQDSPVTSVEEYMAKYPGQTSSQGETQKLLAIGLINHFQRDDMPGTYTSPLNAAHNLVDIMPSATQDTMAHDEVLWDSLIKMNAGDPSSFIYVAPEGADGTLKSNVVKQVENQMVVNAATSSEYQAELRGKRELPRTTFDPEVFDNWGADGYSDSALGQSANTLGQVFSGETPDDPRLSSLYQRKSNVENQLENLPMYKSTEQIAREKAEKAEEDRRNEIERRMREGEVLSGSDVGEDLDGDGTPEEEREVVPNPEADSGSSSDDFE